MRAIVLGLFACSLSAATACAPGDELTSAPVVLAGEGKDDGMNGQLVYPTFLSAKRSRIFHGYSYYEPADALLHDIGSFTAEDDGDGVVGVHGEFLLLRNDSARFAVHLDPPTSTTELRFLLYRYTGQEPFNARAFESEHGLPRHQDWQAVRCADNARQVSAFSGVAVDAVAGTLTTGAGSVFRLSDCGLTSGATPLGVFLLPMRAPGAGTTDDGMAFHWTDVRGSCAAKDCWK